MQKLKGPHRLAENHQKAPESSWLGRMIRTVSTGVVLAVSACTGGDNGHERNTGAQVVDVRPREGEKSHDDHHGKKEVSADVKEKHRKNTEFAAAMKQDGAQKTLDELQKEDPLLVPEDSVNEVVICCIDDRQLFGKNFNIAGAGVLLRNEQLEVVARGAVDIARRKHDRLKKPITIRVRPHLEGQCGAAALSLKWRKEKNPTPKAIDDEAMGGAERTAKIIRERAKDAGIPVHVVVEPFDRKDFLPDPSHPATGVLVNATDMVANHDRKKGPLLFNVSGKLAGEQIAEDDAILAGIIALLSKHGMFESEQGLKKDTPFRIIFAGTKENAQRLKEKAEASLRKHKDLAPYFETGAIVVDTWVPKMDAEK